MEGRIAMYDKILTETLQGERDDWLVSGKIFLSLRLEKRVRNQR